MVKNKPKQKGYLFAMNTVTQKIKFRQSLIKYADKHGTTKAAIKYNVSRQYVYRWKNRCNRTLNSLSDKSYRPLDLKSPREFPNYFLSTSKLNFFMYN